MKIGIIADIHDHIANLQNALQRIGHVDTIICCGDLCSPFIIKQLGENYSKPIHIVFGNNDADLFRISQVARQYSNIVLHGELCELDINGVKFGVNHFDNIGRVLAKSGKYDVVCFGHNHQYEVTHEANTLIINPGEIMGELTGVATCAVFDCDSKQVEKIDLS